VRRSPFTLGDRTAAVFGSSALLHAAHAPLWLSLSGAIAIGLLLRWRLERRK
jgi:hypothetical protein